MKADTKVLSDHHVHSMYSSSGHGQGSLDEIAQAAIAKGLERVVLSDHGTSHWLYGARPWKLEKIREEIDAVNDKYPSFQMLMGMECNIMNSKGKIDMPANYLHLFDVVNAGYHYGILPRDLKSLYYMYILNPLSRLNPKFTEELRKEATDALIKAIQVNDIYVLTHPGAKIPLDLPRLAKACVEEGTAMEINSHHKHLNLEAIREVYDTGVMFSLGSDAHRPDHVGELTSAIDTALAAGIERERIINILR